LTTGSVTSITDSATGGTFKYTAKAGDTIAQLQTAITNAVSAGTLDSNVTATFTGGQLVIATTTAGASLNVSSNDSVMGTYNPTTTAGNSATVYTSDGTGTGSATLTTAISALSATSLGLNADTLTSTTSAKTALTDITNAINTIAAQRGTIGAGINQLTADTNVQATEVQNLTGAQNNVQNADIATVTSHLAQYNILQQTGFDALYQSNTEMQNITKLLQ
jgi:flagellin